MIANVIFDLDGTLMDTTQGVTESVMHVIRKLSLRTLEYKDILQFVGPPIQDSFMKYCGLSFAEAQYAADEFRAYYKNEAIMKAAPYGEIYDLCKELQNRKINMAVATYKREDYAVQLLKEYKFDLFCSVIHGADNNNILVKEDIINLCLNELNAKKEETVLIGDTVYDAVGAKKAGIQFIAVTYGFGFKSAEDVRNYDMIGIAKHPLEVLQII